jgi:GNAT superfamily N-acetyltransferase
VTLWGDSSALWAFARGRQLEGTLSQGPEVGVWPITGMRVHYGWGFLPEEAWKIGAGPFWPPPPEPPGLGEIAKKTRISRYRRVRTLDECKRVLAFQQPTVLASLEITDAWFTAPGGRIPPPSRTDKTVGYHCVAVCGYDNNRAEFAFVNSWGMAWGDKAIGHISYELFQQTCLEMWMMDLRKRRDPPDGYIKNSWGVIEKNCGVGFHGREFLGPGRQRIAWAFATERQDGNIEVEELFVRPEFRRKGYGKALVSQLRELADGGTIKVWIPYADSSPANLVIIETLLRPLSLNIQPSPERWAAIVAM